MAEVTREVWVPGPDGPVLDRTETVTVDDAPAPVEAPSDAVFLTAEAFTEFRARAAAATTIAGLRSALTWLADQAQGGA